jgi:hypothetical protein
MILTHLLYYKHPNIPKRIRIYNKKTLCNALIGRRMVMSYKVTVFRIAFSCSASWESYGLTDSREPISGGVLLKLCRYCWRPICRLVDLLQHNDMSGWCVNSRPNMSPTPRLSALTFVGVIRQSTIEWNGTQQDILWPATTGPVTTVQGQSPQNVEKLQINPQPLEPSINNKLNASTGDERNQRFEHQGTYSEPRYYVRLTGDPVLDGCCVSLTLAYLDKVSYLRTALDLGLTDISSLQHSDCEWRGRSCAICAHLTARYKGQPSGTHCQWSDS